MEPHPVTAWNVLIMNSALPSGTAWNHLNAQDAGLVINDGVTVEIDFEPITAEVLMQDVEVVIVDDPLVIEVEDSPVEVSLVADPIELEFT